MNDEITIELFKPKHVAQVAQLHIEGIKTSFISTLGIDFVATLYGSISTSESGFGFVAIKNENVIGFSIFTTNLNALYRHVVRKSGFKLLMKIAFRIKSFSRIKNMLETLFYPNRIKKLNLPRAELLSMVIAQEGRGTGLAARMTKKSLRECKDRGENSIKALVAVDLIPINKLYKMLGFTVATQIKNHGVISNVYVVELTDNLCSKSHILPR